MYLAATSPHNRSLSLSFLLFPLGVFSRTFSSAARKRRRPLETGALLAAHKHVYVRIICTRASMRAHESLAQKTPASFLALDLDKGYCLRDGGKKEIFRGGKLLSPLRGGGRSRRLSVFLAAITLLKTGMGKYTLFVVECAVHMRAWHTGKEIGNEIWGISFSSPSRLLLPSRQLLLFVHLMNRICGQKVCSWMKGEKAAKHF